MSVNFNASSVVGAGDKPMSVRTPWQWLLSRLRPQCPDCGSEMNFRYRMPEEYREVSPEYFECSCCHSRYMRTKGGPWIDASGSDCEIAYRGTAH
ncbi:MAG: hypothetical protein SFU56_20000 [Capsulimonadales bacterium]|nr:hypothetical protein [Capsulimonadales bacterium]